ncbi:MAG TPA: D-alanyl-D-alanine carboxypeptidase/D-alanyl-D-alanine-endopeptidase [Pseudonocardiaceae bacterium]|nr:D-alanyl-D-alanine carboxypeptidase/D-alanyl-D-alanine-endopeptidase [Pseudonocardiaceae bacterium]
MAGETTQFLPRIPPPAKPVPPVRPVESTQVIPVFRDIPLATETTQHIPVIPGHDSRVDPAVDYDDYGTDDYAQPEPTAKDPARRRGRKRVLIAAGSLLVVLAVGVAVVFASPTVARRLGLTSVAGPVTQSPPSPVVFSAQLKPPNDAGPVPTDSGVNQALGGAAANPALGTLAGTVLDGATGNVLWDHGSTTPVAPASTNKLLTSAAALLTLGPQTTLDTTVVAGSEPGTIILVGGGDPTLSSLPAPQQSVYPGAARIDDLAAQVKAHNPGQITRILVDTSRFSGPPTAPGWDPPSASQDNYAPIQPVMLDGGRLDPTRPDTSRTYTPALAAGQALATRLGLPTSAVATTNTPTPAGAQPLAVVHSATVPDLVTNLLQISDNVLAEELGRAVALADNKPPTFTGGTEAVLDVLRRNGFDTTGVNLTDSSGLSPADRLPPRLLAQILRVAASSDTTDPRVAKLRPLLSGLPIAGSPVGDGTLAGRYQTAPSEAGKGWVRAKTGTLTAQGVYALAGIVLDTDGRVLVFALVSNGAPSATAPQIIDTMAATLRGCGCR